jgi:hypothetical protein
MQGGSRVGDDHHNEDRRPTATPHEWVGLVRRARLGSSQIGHDRKLALLIFGSYADTSEKHGRAPGEGIHCGTSRLATDLEVGLSTAQRHLAWMRSTGMIELTGKGNSRRGLADEYRMILPTPEQADALGIVDPTAYKEMVGAVIRANKEKQHRSRSKISAKPSDLTHTEVCSPDQTSPEPGSDLTLGEVPPNIGNTEPMFLTEPEMVDLSTDLTLTRARGHEEGFIAHMDVEPPDGDRHQCPDGIGWCVACYAELGQAVLAVDSVSGSHCRTHTRTITARPLGLASAIRPHHLANHTQRDDDGVRSGLGAAVGS